MLLVFCLLNGFNPESLVKLLVSLLELTPDVKVVAQVLRDIDNTSCTEDVINLVIDDFILACEAVTGLGKPPVYPSLN